MCSEDGRWRINDIKSPQVETLRQKVDAACNMTSNLSVSLRGQSLLYKYILGHF